MKATFLQRLADYLKKAETAEVPFRGEAIQELGDGIATVYDSMNEFDVYFDRDLWEPTIPQIWGGSLKGLFPPALDGAGLGVLPGLARVPQVSSFEDAVGFAKRQLQSKGDAGWHDNLNPPDSAFNIARNQ